MQRHTLSVVGRVPALHQQGPVLEGPHGVDPGLHGGVDEAAVYPGRDLVALLPGHVGTLARAGVVLSSVEWHRALSPTLSIERVITPAARKGQLDVIWCAPLHPIPGDGDLGHLNRTGLHLTGHQDLGGDHLAKEGQHCRPVDD